MTSNQPPNRPSLSAGESVEPPSQDSALADREKAVLISELNRSEVLRTVWLWCVCAFLVMITVVVLTAIFAVAWHYLAPAKLAWLNEEQLRPVRSFLFSGSVLGTVGFVSNYLRQRLSPPAG